MFQDSLLVNVIVFALGQLTAAGYLRTGRIRRGVALMVGGWALADVALLARFAFTGREVAFVSALVAMQVYSLVELAVFTFGRLRRRNAAVRLQADAQYRQAFVHYLRNELEPAERLFRALLRQDPWDVDSALSLGCVLARAGRTGRARAWLRVARALDREARYTYFIAEELRRARVAVRGPSRGPSLGARDSPTTPSSVASPDPR